MVKKFFIGANWKMNLTLEESEELFRTLSASIIPHDLCEVVVFVPQPFLGVFSSNDRITVAAQNFHAPELSGAFTGETSLEQLRSLNISTVLAGHSERRLHFNESNETTLLKAKKAVDEGFRVVLCCGEPQEIRQIHPNLASNRNEALKYVYNQVLPIVEWPKTALQKIIIAYEPIWAIGTGVTPCLEDIEFIQFQVQSMLETATKVRIPVIYGGSCDAENSKGIFSLKGVHGGLIGGASLQAKTLLQIIANAC